ncbi:glycoside hydrolase family 78 [Coraliomargarita sinensis]|uniref:alpha-L-rhamnosidase n=1 Tax=Coraliomargarita sinensis TaxID=2174842 RepID=A0A317ZK25_9BACT|nr:family 78 glycoside hydrolase catalytic domain [Coraliomargarita sinensis]PXA04557.1 glycoside hydrolase family 78 [Coraliomargarita sinensis]
MPSILRSNQRTAICALLVFSLNLSAALLPVDLQCEGHSDPLAAPSEPRLSWRLSATEGERGQIQTAWQILVASRPELLEVEKADLWDSGKTKTDRSPQVNYAGKPLEAGQRCYWKVRTWNANGQVSNWSETARWEVALVNPSDWQGAVWIDDGKDNPTKDEDFYKTDPAPLMRETFELAKPIVRARLHVAGLGLCYPSLNGERLVDQVFDPQWTNFDERILYRTHDVTALLQEGANSLGLALGNGWYNPLPMRMWGRRNLREALPVGRPRAIACLIVEHSDGSKTTITTGPDWTTKEGPTLKNSIYLGEVHDARMAIADWDTPDYDASAWKPVRVRDDYPLEPLQPLIAPPVRLSEPFTSERVSSPSEGVYIVDFGRNFTGLPDMHFDVPAGTEITLRFGELLHKDGTLNPMSSVCGQIKRNVELEDGTVQSIGGPGAPEIAWQQDIYIAKGGGERYRPDFTFHGFRYMEITGLPYEPKPEDFMGLYMRSDLETKGQFASSNELLNEIQKVTLNSFITNVVTVQSDCPHRERFAYGGDIVATSEAFLMNYDMAGFYAKTVRDWTDAALPDGRLTDTAPFVGVDYCGVGWAMVHPLLLEQLHQHYGARLLIEENLPAAIRWLDAEADRRKNDLVVTGLGDHEAIGPRAAGPELTTPKFVHSARRIARLAEVVGWSEAAKRATRYAEESSTAWEASYLDRNTGRVGTGTQSAQTFALGFADTTERTQEQIFEYLLRDLTAPEDAPRLTTGIYGTRILLEQLSKRGRSDLAYDLAARESYPSWGHMLNNGATTLWENWEGSEGNFSNNHPMFGSVSAWFFRWLGGIQAAEDAVGFDRIYIRPQVVPELEWVNSSHESIRGLIVSNWTANSKGSEHEIVIPQNTIAIIELPAAPDAQVTESGLPIHQAEGLKVLPRESLNTLRIKALSGHYQFKVTE